MENEKNIILSFNLPEYFEKLLQTTSYEIKKNILFSSLDNDEINFELTGLCIIGDSNEDAENIIYKIKSSSKFNGIPLIVITKNSRHEILFKAGADSFIDISESEDKFFSQVSFLFNNSKSNYKRVGSSSSFLQAMNSARQLPILNRKNSTNENDFYPDDSMSLKQFISLVENSMDPDFKTTMPPDFAEGLESIDIQAYINDSSGVGESILLDDKDEHQNHKEKNQFQSVNAENIEDNNIKQHIKDDSNKADYSFFTDKSNVKTEIQSFFSSSKHVIDDISENNYKPFYQLLYEVCEKVLTGTITAQNGKVERKIIIDSGQPLIVYSDSPQDRLVEILYNNKKISDDKYNEICEIIEESGRKAGVVLVDNGVISSRELFPVVREHYEYLLFDTFTWRDGLSSFKEEEIILNENILIIQPVEVLILNGFKRFYDIIEFKNIIDDSYPISLSKEISYISNVINCSADEYNILKMCNGQNTIKDITNKIDSTYLYIEPFLAALTVIKMVKSENFTPAKADNQFLTESAVFVETENLSTTISSFNDSLIDEKYKEIVEGTYFDILEIAEDSTVKEVLFSYNRLKKEYEEYKTNIEIEDSLAEKIDTILSVVDEAKELLGNSEVLQHYKEALNN
ncbi:MAG: hypothetical protein JXR91_09510 [Deltaproteobacteria bacterium]|nr:hypothetical protein [Deltaproteobacteria bacterium]